MPQPLKKVSCGLVSRDNLNKKKFSKDATLVTFYFIISFSIACVCNKLSKYRAACASISRRLFFQAVAALLRFVREKTVK